MNDKQFTGEYTNFEINNILMHKQSDRFCSHQWYVLCWYL